MALIECKECKAEISDAAGACPKCGIKVTKPTSRFAIAFVGIVSIILIKATYDSSSNRSPPTPKVPTAAEQKTEAEFQSVVLGAKLLKKSMKNPDSFKLESAVLMNDGVVCYEYRSTNSFNAVVPGFYVSLLGVGSQKTKDWNKYCANKSGTNYSYASHAL